jgi:hypothetical protein
MPRRTLVLLVLAALAGCRSHDPKQELEVADVETYWVVDSPKGATQYISPAVRFRLRNKAQEPIRSIQATANFKRVDEQENWGSAWEQVTAAGKPLPSGQSVLVVLRSDGRYTSATDDPESMFEHELFKDARVEVFVRVGSSSWAKMAETAIERRIGTRGARELGAP